MERGAVATALAGAGEVTTSFDDLYGYVQPFTCAVASEGDSPVHYTGVEIHSDDYPGGVTATTTRAG